MSAGAGAGGTVLERLGGRPCVAAILADFYQRLASDVLVGFFFAGRDLEAIAQGQEDFLAHAFGEGVPYTGRPPADAHRSLPPILRGHFDRRITVLRQVLADHEVERDLIAAWLRVERSMRKVVVG